MMMANFPPPPRPPVRAVERSDASPRFDAIETALSALAVEVRSLKGTLDAQVVTLGARIDSVGADLTALVGEVEGEGAGLVAMRAKLDTLSDLESSLAAAATTDARVARLSGWVGRLKTERQARRAAERQIDAYMAEVSAARVEARRYKKRARAVVWAAVLAAAGTVGVTVAGAILSRCHGLVQAPAPASGGGVVHEK